MIHISHHSKKENDNNIFHLYLVLKRSIDILGALIGLIIFSPIFLIISMFIKIDSNGPIFFSHKRLGRNGKEIKIYKFRTMVMDAEKMIQKFTEEQKREFAKNFKLQNDPRITKVGNFLRKTSLDELPQFLNILKGDLSIVGPRPIVKKELSLYSQNGKKLLSITPGLTGYWQAHGRSNTTYDERVHMDMYYIDNMSLMLDLSIIFKTIISVLKKEGAV